MKARYGKAFTDTAESLPGCEMDTAPLADAPLCDAFATPTEPAPAPSTRTVRRFTARPRAIATDSDVDIGVRFTLRGGLPDWRHYGENRQRAKDEYAAKNIAPTLAKPEVTPGASNAYQAAKDGESLAETLTPAQTLTIHQLMDPGHEFTKAVASPKTEQDS
jgi:hypothetical protein